MLVSITVKGGPSVMVEVEDSYGPDILDDVCKRARDTFRLALADLQHAEAEHTSD